MYTIINDEDFIDYYKDYHYNICNQWLVDNKLILKSYRADAGIIIDTIEGTSIFEFGNILQFFGCIPDAIAIGSDPTVYILDKFVHICPFDDGYGILVRTSKVENEAYHIFQQIEIATTKYGLEIIYI